VAWVIRHTTERERSYIVTGKLMVFMYAMSIMEFLDRIPLKNNASKNIKQNIIAGSHHAVNERADPRWKQWWKSIERVYGKDMFKLIVYFLEEDEDFYFGVQPTEWKTAFDQALRSVFDGNRGYIFN